MYAVNLENDLRMIVTASVNYPTLMDVQPNTILSEMGFRMDKLLTFLGVDAQNDLESNKVTLHNLAIYLESRPTTVLEKVRKLATTGRIKRLIQGTFLLTENQIPVYDETERWWFELVRQIIWWYMRQLPDGVQIVRSGVPIRTMQNLVTLGVLNIENLADKERADANRQVAVDIMVRSGFPKEQAHALYLDLELIAFKLAIHYEGRLQSFLNPHANQMTEVVCGELLAGIEAPPFLSNAVRMWLHNTTSLPISVWSPSTSDFIKKFTDADCGFGEEILVSLAEMGGLPRIDGALTEFMDTLCRKCDKDNPDNQFCVKQFAMILQVECPAHPEFRSMV